MSLTIELNAELEAQLQEEAARIGVDASTFVVRALEQQLQRKSRHATPSHLAPEESALLQKINEGLPETVWQEYHDLIAKRRAETLISQEHERLISLSDRIEEVHAQRMAYVTELAQRRQVPLETLMKQLGIRPRKV